MVRALQLGCTLIDTAATYLNGESEQLVGEVLREHPEFDAFVITKAGYIQNENLEVLSQLTAAGLPDDEVVSISSDFKYSIHPSFLSRQIELSCSRLGVRRIDGFLLHNPEHYFEHQGSPALGLGYYASIKRAFEFLEEEVLRGRIRYYGISSNTFPFSTAEKTTTDLHKVLAIAKEVSSSNHFALVEFPFNLLETEAQQLHHGGTSLIKLANENGLVTISNRPLNARTATGLVRLATYEDTTDQEAERIDDQIFDRCVALIKAQLHKCGLADDALQYDVVRFLEASWTRLPNPEAVNEIIHGYLYPFLHQLYANQIPIEDLRIFLHLHETMNRYARIRMTRDAMEMRQGLTERGIIPRDDNRPLAIIACEFCLRSGIEHVLVGMRNIKYAEALQDLFRGVSKPSRQISA
jgi:aryl-alcohol dehydrogenase-like predicted oxidoreductase